MKPSSDPPDPEPTGTTRDGQALTMQTHPTMIAAAVILALLCVVVATESGQGSGRG